MFHGSIQGALKRWQLVSASGSRQFPVFKRLKQPDNLSEVRRRRFATVFVHGTPRCAGRLLLGHYRVRGKPHALYMGKTQ